MSEEEEVERKSEIMEKAFGRSGARVQDKETQAMDKSESLDPYRSKEIKQKLTGTRSGNKDGKMKTDRNIGNLKDRLGRIKDNGLKRWQNKL